MHTTHNDSDCINVRINSLTINHTDENGNRLEKGKVYMETSTYIPSELTSVPENKLHVYTAPKEFFKTADLDNIEIINDNIYQ